MQKQTPRNVTSIIDSVVDITFHFKPVLVSSLDADNISPAGIYILQRNINRYYQVTLNNITK